MHGSARHPTDLSTLARRTPTAALVATALFIGSVAPSTAFFRPAHGEKSAPAYAYEGDAPFGANTIGRGIAGYHSRFATDDARPASGSVLND